MVMETSIKQYEQKLIKVLELFLTPEYKIANDAYLELLISYLSGKHDKVLGQQLIQLPMLIEWLDRAITTWEKTQSVPSTSVQTFTLHTCSLVSTSEIQFIKLDIVNVYTRLCDLFKINTIPKTPSVKLGYVKLLSSFLKHDTGCKWLVKTERWKDVVRYCQENNTIYVTREGHKFLYELLTQFVEICEDFSLHLVAHILEPLKEDIFHQETNILPEVDDFQLQKSLMPTLVVIAHILENAYLAEKHTHRSKIPPLFFSIETKLWNVVNLSHDIQLEMIVSKILLLIYFGRIENNTLPSEEIKIDDFREFGFKFFSLMKLLTTKRSATVILSITHLAQIYFRKICDRLPSVVECSISSKPLYFENQLLIFQILPICCCSSQNRILKAEEDEFLDMFINKLFKISCEHTTRQAYQMRDMLETLDNMWDIGEKAVYSVMKTRQYLNRDRAVIVFQSLMYAMKETVYAIKMGKLTSELIYERSSYVSAVLDGLATLIKDFKITWQESVETLCLMTIVMEILKFPVISSKLAVQALKLIELSIENFMPPNLALLVDKMEGTAMIQVTPLLYNRMHDTQWEVRDSALEVLRCITIISELKFPAFQKLVLDANLCSLTVSMATDDSESYVRASAVKCLSAMIRVEAFRVKCFNEQNIPEKAMSILTNETEGIVRSEAALLMGELHEHQTIPASLLSKVNNVMASAVIVDLHWEVKVNSLKFWEKVIQDQLSDQGMIDGTFPSVTFSKEHRKIVSLTACEILKRLTKVLENLSNNGCLGVLLTALNDDCDLKVVQSATDILDKLVTVLKKYNMLDVDKSRHCAPTKAVWDTASITAKPRQSTVKASLGENSNNVDKILDSIVNLDDINLLATVYRSQMQVDHTLEETGECSMQTDDKLEHLKLVTPESFLTYVTNKDVKLVIEERTRWLRNCSDDLGSLLDDILKSYDHCDVNGLDCY